MASSPITSWQIHGEKLEAVTDFLFLGSKSTTDRDPSREKTNTTQHNATQHNKTKQLAPWKEGYDKQEQHIKKQRHHFANKGPYRQSYGLSSIYVWI